MAVLPEAGPQIVGDILAPTFRLASEVCVATVEANLSIRSEEPAYVVEGLASD